jgi:hypothetical protein
MQKARIQSESLQALAEDASVGYVGTEGSWQSRGSLGRSADVGVATEEEEEGEGVPLSYLSRVGSLGFSSNHRVG